MLPGCGIALLSGINTGILSLFIFISEAVSTRSHKFSVQGHFELVTLSVDNFHTSSIQVSSHTTMNPGQQQPAVNVSVVFIAALRRMLRPIVRTLVMHQISYPMLCKMLKSLYVDVAIEDFPLNGKEQTDSRINLLTGVHRKDVKKLRSEEIDDDEMPESVSLGSQLVSIWVSDQDYLDESGHPRPLQRLQSANEEMSFEGLVRRVNKDIRPRVVLDEWLRLGAATLDDKDRVWLRTEAFIPEKGFDEKAYYFGQNLHDHIAASAHNLAGASPPFFERSLTSDALTPESAAELAKLIEESSMQALLSVNRKALSMEEQDKLNSEPKRRICYGIYFYEQPTDSKG